MAVRTPRGQVSMSAGMRASRHPLIGFVMGGKSLLATLGPPNYQPLCAGFWMRSRQQVGVVGTALFEPN